MLWFEESAPNTVFMKIYLHEKWPKNVSGKFGEIRAKFLRTPENLPAPTPMTRDIMVIDTGETSKYSLLTAMQ